jgi:Leucine-rich repeat (LRR) protein
MMKTRLHPLFVGSVMVVWAFGCEKVPTFKELTSGETAAPPPSAAQPATQPNVVVTPAAESNPPVTSPEAPKEDPETLITALNSKTGTLTDQEIVRATNVSEVTERLTTLDASNSKVTDYGLLQLKQFPHLAQVNITGLQITGSGIDGLASLNELRELTAVFVKIGMPDGWEKLGKLSQIERLDLRSSNITDAEIHYLMSLSALKELNVSNTRITDAGLAELAKLPNLEILWIAGNQGINGSGLLAFVRSKNKPGLRCLYASSTTLSPEGMVNVKRIESLELFDNTYANVNDQLLYELRTANNLKSLIVPNNQLTSASGVTLRTLRNLEFLDLSKNSSVGDPILNALITLNALKTLDLRHTGCTLAAVQEFRKRRKNCEVIFNDSPQQ